MKKVGPQSYVLMKNVLRGEECYFLTCTSVKTTILTECHKVKIQIEVIHANENNVTFNKHILIALNWKMMRLSFYSEFFISMFVSPSN